jgi:hypothetical protein
VDYHHFTRKCDGMCDVCDCDASVRLPEDQTRPRSIRLNEARWEKLKALGMGWLARAIDRARIKE